MGRVCLRRMGMRSRVTAAFALGALLLSVSLSVMTYSLTRGFLVRQRESSALRQSYLHAQVVRAGLMTANSDVPRLLGSLDTGSGSQSVLRYRGRWFASSLAVGRHSVPPRLRDAVESGRPARQLTRVDGHAQLAIGVPLPAVDAVYFELVPLSELDRTLRILSGALGLAAAITTVAGAAVGRWAANRLLRPLREVSAAAADVAGGSLGIRLDAAEDRDLAGLADSFNAMVDALQARIERDARFASDVSHELRSPLTTLATAVDVMLARRSEMPDRARQALDLLAADVRRFERMVESLLEISRAEADGQAIVTEVVALAELVGHSLGPPGVPIVVEPDANGAMVRVDKRRIEQVVSNLAANALVHGGGLVRVGVRRRGQLVHLEFDDAGPGVPLDERERIFERFARVAGTDRRSAGDGVGLGLALVREHVRLHGGAAWVEDRPGGGARFVVALPEVTG